MEFGDAEHKQLLEKAAKLAGADPSIAQRIIDDRQHAACRAEVAALRRALEAALEVSEAQYRVSPARRLDWARDIMTAALAPRRDADGAEGT